MRGDQVLGCLLAGAVGDALGAPVEFLATSAIRARYGPAGITGYEEVYDRRGAITDETQMTLFTAAALLAGGDPLDRLRDAYLRWPQTQDESLHFAPPVTVPAARPLTRSTTPRGVAP